MLKGRDIEEKFKNMGLERATIFCIRELAEAQMALNTEMSEMIKTMDLLIKSVNMVATGAGNMRKHVERMAGHMNFEKGFDGDKK